MPDICYVSDGKLYAASGGKPALLASEAVEKYRQTVKELSKKREWKTTGQGAEFMGVALMPQHASEVHAQVESVVCTSRDKIIYAAALESSCAIYTKNPQAPDEPEGYVLRRTDTRLYHMDYSPGEKRFVASVSDGYLEKHLALCGEDGADFRLITEGDSVDITPSFSATCRDVIYFSSAGFYIDKEKGRTHYSPYGISRFDTRSGEITEVAAGEKFDYISPREGADGRLYCIRRKKEEERAGPSLLDVLLAPVRLLRAVFGWLNFFTQRYSGESLVKGAKGDNPAKNKQKSDEEVFIDGNLVNAGKNLKENAMQGDKYPGIAPKNWELIEILPQGGAEVVKRGVLDYTLDAEGRVIYSNGKYVILGAEEGEEVLCEAKVARSLCVIP